MNRCGLWGDVGGAADHHDRVADLHLGMHAACGAGRAQVLNCSKGVFDKVDQLGRFGDSQIRYNAVKAFACHLLIASTSTRPVELLGGVMRSKADNVGAMSAGVAASK